MKTGISQSGFIQHHSTETALTKVTNNIHLNTNSGNVSVLILFDTVGHAILHKRMENWEGLAWPVLNWKTIFGKQEIFCANW